MLPMYVSRPVGVYVPVREVMHVALKVYNVQQSPLQPFALGEQQVILFCNIFKYVN